MALGTSLIMSANWGTYPILYTTLVTLLFITKILILSTNLVTYLILY